MKLVQFYEDCGRMGEIEGLFICEEKNLEMAYGKNVYFDEPLGKFSEYDITLDYDNTTVLDIGPNNDEILAVLLDKIGYEISGYNVVDMEDDKDNERADGEPWVWFEK